MKTSIQHHFEIIKQAVAKFMHMDVEHCDIHRFKLSDPVCCVCEQAMCKDRCPFRAVRELYRQKESR